MFRHNAGYQRFKYRMCLYCDKEGQYESSFTLPGDELHGGRILLRPGHFNSITLQWTFAEHTRNRSVVEVGIDEGDPEEI